MVDMDNLIVKPNFKKRVVFNENLIAIEMNRTNIFIAIPIIVGVSVLEISKLCMYDFHYDFMLKQFSYEDCKLLYTDTDSFIYNIQCDDVYNLLRNYPEKFDTSDFPNENRFGIELKNKKIPGLMKDGCNGKILKEFVGLRSKMYSIKIAKTENEIETIKKAKGVKPNVIKKKIDFEKYVECLKTNVNVIDVQCTIKSKLHKVFSIEQTKSMLNSQDDKRKIL